MQSDFAEWYGLVSLNPSTALLEARKKAIARIVKGIEPSNALDILRVYMGANPKASEFFRSVKTTFLEEDASFAVKNNNAEMQVLFGAIVVELVTGQPSLAADTVATATSCIRRAREQIRPLVPNLLGYAEEYLIKEGHRVRTTTRIAKIGQPGGDLALVSNSLQALEQASTAAIATPQTVVDLSSSITDLSSSIKKLSAAYQAYSAKVNQAEESLTRNNSLLHEQNQVLWWLLAGWSRQAQQPLSTLSLPFAAILAGIELAELTEVLPGHPYAQAFLNEILGRSRTSDGMLVSIQDIVNVAPEMWRTECSSMVNESKSLDFCPVRTATIRSLGHQEDWMSELGANTQLFTEAVPAAQLAYQVYVECLLARCLN